MKVEAKPASGGLCSTCSRPADRELLIPPYHCVKLCKAHWHQLRHEVNK